MRKNRHLMIGALLTAVAVMAFSPARALAEELAIEETGEILSEETAGSSAGLVTKIEAPEKSEYSFDYKPILDKVLEELPKTAQVWYGDDCRTMDISWKCEEDYDKDLDSYHFIPYIEGESFAEDAD
ncbi:MAG: hypothetical protein K6A90_09150, partial [Lachnospiraceae bacterium]|nr:hypothetical protein [Lachnospiraceae bacterium]